MHPQKKTFIVVPCWTASPTTRRLHINIQRHGAQKPANMVYGRRLLRNTTTQTKDQCQAVQKDWNNTRNREVDHAFWKSKRRPDTFCWTRCRKRGNIIVVPWVSNQNTPSQEEQQDVHLKKKTGHSHQLSNITIDIKPRRCQLLHLFCMKLFKCCTFLMLKSLYLAIQPTPYASPTWYNSKIRRSTWRDVNKEYLPYPTYIHLGDLYKKRDPINKVSCQLTSPTGTLYK